jgi:dienelactone hydrolase
MRTLAVLAAAAALAACTPAVPLGAPGAPDVRAAGQLSRPDGAGPFPAVVVLHGCSGVTMNQQAWAQRLNRWGYVAFVVDSFTPRGVDVVCGTSAVPPSLRAKDAFAAASWLRTQPFVDPARIGVIGFSHGGSTVMQAIREAAVRSADAQPFRAAVAYYPGCTRDLARLATDVLILIGDADDWTPAERCAAYVASRLADGHAVELKRYPGAYHAFDAQGAARSYLGHTLGYHPAAAEDSFARTRAFLDARLMAPGG